MLGLGGGREVIGLQVALAGTEDPEEKPEVCHLTRGDPSVFKVDLFIAHLNNVFIVCNISLHL